MGASFTYGPSNAFVVALLVIVAVLAVILAFVGQFLARNHPRIGHGLWMIGLPLLWLPFSVLHAWPLIYVGSFSLWRALRPHRK